MTHKDGSQRGWMRVMNMADTEGDTLGGEGVKGIQDRNTTRQQRRERRHVIAEGAQIGRELGTGMQWWKVMRREVVAPAARGRGFV